MRANRKFFAALCVLAVLLAAALFAGWCVSKKALPVLMYHHITNQHGVEKLELSRDTLLMQMKFLKDNGFQVVDARGLLTDLTSQQRPAKHVALTFDDGNKDNYTNAMSALDQWGFKGIFFIVTDWVGKPGFMSWDEIRDLEKHGHIIGSHTLTHRFLTEIPLAEAKEEIYNSKALIEENLGHPIRFFCYPAGRFNTAVQKLVQEAGYEAAFTTGRGSSSGPRDVFAIPRIRVSEACDSPLEFWWRVTGYYLMLRERSHG